MKLTQSLRCQEKFWHLFLCHRELRFYDIERLREDRTAAEWKMSCCDHAQKMTKSVVKTTTWTRTMEFKNIRFIIEEKTNVIRGRKAESVCEITIRGERRMGII